MPATTFVRLTLLPSRSKVSAMHAKALGANLFATIMLLIIIAAGAGAVLNAAEPGGKAGGGLL
jgi:hypothetical protein